MDSNERIGYYAGFGSILIIIFFSLIAYLVSLDEYNPLIETISKLGLTNNGSIYFIIGTTVGGILLSIYFNFYFSNTLIKTKMNNFGAYLGIISGFALVGVGIIQDKPELVYQIGHTLSSGIFFTSMGLTIFLYSLQLKESNSSVLKNIGFFGFLACGIAILHFFLSFFKGTENFFGLSFTVNAVWQKITVSFYIVWNIALFIFLKKNELPILSLFPNGI